MARRKAADKPVERKPIPRWLLISGAIAAIVTPLLGYCAARGGPEAIQELKEAAGYVKPPRIVAVQPRVANKKRFLVSIENPSLRRIQITGYVAEPMVQEVAALSVIRAEEDKPERCVRPRLISLRIPLPVEAKSDERLEVEPWLDECDFAIRIVGTTGESNQAFWMPTTIQRFRELHASDPSAYRLALANAGQTFVEHLIKSGLPDPATMPGGKITLQKCPDGAVVLARESCPPPAPPPLPPPPPSAG